MLRSNQFFSRTLGGLFLSFFLFTLLAVPASAGTATKQLIVAIVPDDGFMATVELFKKDKSGDWEVQSQPWPVLIGKKGWAWGRGLNPAQEGRQKVEGDKRTPAGRFKIGTVYGFPSKLPFGSKGWPYHQVSDHDAWVDDSRLPDYNHLVTFRPGTEPSWFSRQRMHREDPAYYWRLLIEHNYPRSKPGMGSAIFFHVRRGEKVPTAGCITMSLDNLENLLVWLDPAAKPEVVILNLSEYARLWKSWKLPPYELVESELNSVAKPVAK